MPDAVLFVFFQFPPSPAGSMLPVEVTNEIEAVAAAAERGHPMTPTTLDWEGKTWNGYRDHRNQFYVCRRIAGDFDMLTAMTELGVMAMVDPDAGPVATTLH